MPGLTANGNSVGVYETAESGSEFYDYQEPATHQAQGLEDVGVTNQGSTRGTYIYLHKDTTTGGFDLGLHHYSGNDTTQLQAQVTFDGFGIIVRAWGFVFVRNVGIDISQHGDTSYVYQSGTPVRNAGGGSFVYETGTTLTPGSARTLVQDEVEDETATGLGADSYLVNSNGDPVTKHLYDGSRGDGAVYGVREEATQDVTFTVTTLDDGRDDGQPLPDEWVVRGPGGTVTQSTDNALTVTVDTTP